MKIIHIFNDAQGESHYGEIDYELVEVDFAPPAPPFLVSQAQDVSAVLFATIPAGWEGNWHPAPARQLYIQRSGVMQVTVSDGETRRLEPGDVVLVEDIVGKGHVTRIVSDVPLECVYVRF